MQIDNACAPLVPCSGTVSRQAEGGLRAVARDLEAAFISEMLKHSGLGAARGGPGGGGTGETHFASLLRDEHARLLAERGGIGLAEGIFRALVARHEAGGGAAAGASEIRPR